MAVGPPALTSIRQGCSTLSRYRFKQQSHQHTDNTRDISEDTCLQRESGHRKGESCLVPSQLGVCVLDDSNSLPLCTCPRKTTKAPQVLILWSQRNFSKFLKNLLGVKDVEARSSGVQERKTCDQEGEGKRELLNWMKKDHLHKDKVQCVCPNQYSTVSLHDRKQQVSQLQSVKQTSHALRGKDLVLYFCLLTACGISGNWKYQSLREKMLFFFYPSLKLVSIYHVV